MAENVVEGNDFAQKDKEVISYDDEVHTYPSQGLYLLEATIFAFAVHLLLGDRRETVEFDQSLMRQHLLKCLRTEKFSPFPTKKKCG